MKPNAAVLALAASVAMTGQAGAQSDDAGHFACAERDLVTMRLANNYGEYFAGGGLRDAQSVFEVWVSDETEGTWTILMTRADGTTCVMASGTNWRTGLRAETPMGIPG